MSEFDFSKYKREISEHGPETLAFMKRVVEAGGGLMKDVRSPTGELLDFCSSGMLRAQQADYQAAADRMHADYITHLRGQE